MAKSKSVFGLYTKRSDVESAVGAMKDAAFLNSDISVLLPEDLDSKELATEKNTKAPEGATNKVESGAIVGGALGWLAGICALALPGIGPFIAAGPIVAAMAGSGPDDATGGFVGSLIGSGIPEYEARRFQGKLLRGGMLLAVHCETSDEIKHAREIMQITGADDVAFSSEPSGNLRRSA